MDSHSEHAAPKVPSSLPEFYFDLIAYVVPGATLVAGLVFYFPEKFTRVLPRIEHLTGVSAVPAASVFSALGTLLASYVVGHVLSALALVPGMRDLIYPKKDDLETTERKALSSDEAFRVFYLRRQATGISARNLCLAFGMLAIYVFLLPLVHNGFCHALHALCFLLLAIALGIRSRSLKTRLHATLETWRKTTPGM